MECPHLQGPLSDAETWQCRFSNLTQEDPLEASPLWDLHDSGITESSLVNHVRPAALEEDELPSLHGWTSADLEVPSFGPGSFLSMGDADSNWSLNEESLDRSPSMRPSQTSIGTTMQQHVELAGESHPSSSLADEQGESAAPRNQVFAGIGEGFSPGTASEGSGPRRKQSGCASRSQGASESAAPQLLAHVQDYDAAAHRNLKRIRMQAERGEPMAVGMGDQGPSCVAGANALQQQQELPIAWGAGSSPPSGSIRSEVPVNSVVSTLPTSPTMHCCSPSPDSSPNSVSSRTVHPMQSLFEGHLVLPAGHPQQAVPRRIAALEVGKLQPKRREAGRFGRSASGRRSASLRISPPGLLPATVSSPLGTPSSSFSAPSSPFGSPLSPFSAPLSPFTLVKPSSMEGITLQDLNRSIRSIGAAKAVEAATWGAGDKGRAFGWAVGL